MFTKMSLLECGKNIVIVSFLWFGGNHELISSNTENQSVEVY